MGLRRGARRARAASPRTVLMCRPRWFTVSYRINPWMHPNTPTDTALAEWQWQQLHDTYRELGFAVHLIDPVPHLPDMVFTANGGFVLGGVACGARFRHPERQPEAAHFMAWFRVNGFVVHEPQHVNEGEGDFLLAGDTILAGTGFRSTPASHAELQRLYGRKVVTLRLVNPDYYHLDTALAVLDPDGGAVKAGIAFAPAAFDEASRAELRRRFPGAIEVSEADAGVFGLNAFSDGRHVVVAAQAGDLQGQLRAAGYEPVPVDVSELWRGGGGIKCCTLELRR